MMNGNADPQPDERRQSGRTAAPSQILPQARPRKTNAVCVCYQSLVISLFKVVLLF